ncbi:MAG: hypothetical protein IJA34_11370 [Lachnospiraceae bacterium]|nr:hypothetical protein [Lachnospiraceae bacterium]
MKETNTPYDDVYRTLLQECKVLIIPVINEVFKTNYKGTDTINLEENEIFIDFFGESTKKITDSSFSIESSNEKRHYHIECQSSSDGSMIIRMYEYDSQIALKHSMLKDYILEVEFPESALIYLRHNKNTPDTMKIKISTPGGKVCYDIPTLKVKKYDIDTIFKKNLLFLIPFYIFTYEDSLEEIDNTEEKLFQLKKEYSNIVLRLNMLCEEGIITEYMYKTICQLSERVIESLARKYDNVRKGVVSVMGGKILDYEAKRIKDAALAEGISQGITQGISQGLSQAKTENIKVCIELLRKYGVKDEDIVKEIVIKFEISEMEAKEYLNNLN